MKIYQSEEYGCIYWVENGVLMYAPMLKNGGVIDLDNDGSEVDWDFLKEDNKEAFEYDKMVMEKLLSK